MKLIRISPECVTKLLTTNYTFNSCIIQKGLPKDCELISARYIKDQGDIELLFREPNDRNCEIIDVEVVKVKSDIDLDKLKGE